MKTKTPGKNLPARLEPTARVVSNALTTHLHLPPIRGKTPGERINFLHSLSVESGVISIAAAIYAGWELSNIRAKCPHGTWLTWLEKNTSISDDTARNYIKTYEKHLAEARAALPEPVAPTVPPSMEELEAACANTDAKTLTDLYIQQGLVKRNEKWGGDRRAAAEANGKRVGRPVKSEAVLQLRIDAWADRFVDDNSEAVFDSQWHLRLDPERRAKVLEVAKRIAEDLG